jgi:hypothetical protein
MSQNLISMIVTNMKVLVHQFMILMMIGKVPRGLIRLIPVVVWLYLTIVHSVSAFSLPFAQHGSTVISSPQSHQLQ